jgi:hypothetical protein
MAAASNRIHRRMACRSNFIRYALCLLLLACILSGCVSLRFDKISQGADVPALTAELKEGKATLTEVLDHYGAPADVVDMNGNFALLYKKSFYQGGQLSLGIPLPDLHFQSGFKIEATANLLRHDLLALIFTAEGLLAGTMYERGASQPFWENFWK